MTFKIRVRHLGDTGDGWWEDYVKVIDDAQGFAGSLIEWFNNTCKEGERRRELLEVVIISPGLSANDFDPARLIQSLRSCVCPSCNGPKKPRMSLCGREYRWLPRNMQRALYDLIGEGYEEAMIAAFNYLKADKFHGPPPHKPAAATTE